MACRGCGHTRILMTADRAALVGHWSSRIRSDFTSGAQKGGLGHALNKAVLRCSNQWAVDDYDLHVNVDVDGKSPRPRASRVDASPPRRRRVAAASPPRRRRPRRRIPAVPSSRTAQARSRTR